MAAENVRALVVDDAAFMRKALVEILSSHEGIEVVGVARHGREALEAIDELKPDVVTLDVDMPVMDGITTIKHIMVRGPVPVVMVSGLADEGHITFEALRLGAVDFFPKPSGTISRDMEEHGSGLARAVKAAAAVNPMGIVRARKKTEAAGIQESGSDKAIDPGPRHADQTAVQEPSCAVMILATHGAAGKLFRFLYAVPPSSRTVLHAAVDLPKRVLGSCSRQMTRFLGWSVAPLEAPPADSMQAGVCYLFRQSDTEAPGMEAGPADDGKGPDAPVQTVQKEAEQLMKSLSSRFKEGFMVAVLGGEEWESTAPFMEVLEQGGQIVALTPSECVMGALSDLLIRQGLAEEAPCEMEIWTKSRNFMRRSALKSAGQDQG